MEKIGFATEFYTLWSVWTEPQYCTDSYGKHWLVGHNTHYDYLKNISTSLEKVKALYPSLEIDEELKGTTQSWTKQNSQDLCPQIMKYGKYRGQDLNELVKTDWGYVLWLCENGNGANSTFARELPDVKLHFYKLTEQADKVQRMANECFQKLVYEGSYSFEPDGNLRVSEDEDYNKVGYMEVVVEDLIMVTFVFPENLVGFYSYKGFEYGLPLIKGQAKRIKGKQIKLEFVPIDEEMRILEVTNFILL